MKQLLLLISLVLTLPCLAQDDLQIKQKLQVANRYIKGIAVTQDYTKAIALYRQCADAGSGRAMNALGMMYKDGKGVETDIPLAITWFEKAGEAGYPKGYCNLGYMYKVGDGVELDYYKAYEYFARCAETGYDGGMYATGYMLYKGLGVEQNYAEAIERFKVGAVNERASCMFMLGLCYRNGYGVEKDIDTARQWLIKSADKGYWQAKKELELVNAETATEQLAGLKSSEEVVYESVEVNYANVDIAGEWIGELMVFDYGKQKVLERRALTVDFKVSGQIVSGLWQEEGLGSVELNGTINNNAVHYAKGSFKGEGRYGVKHNWQFDQGRFRAVTEGDEVVLVGNMRHYSSNVMEPGKPMFIRLRQSLVTDDFIAEEENGILPDTLSIKPMSLQATITSAAALNALVINSNSLLSNTPANDSTALLKSSGVLAEDTSKAIERYNNLFEDDKLQLLVYPNPFTQSFTVEYTIAKPGKVNIKLFDMAGRVVKQIEDLHKDSGTYNLKVNYDGQSGTYLLVLITDDEQESQLIVKTN